MLKTGFIVILLFVVIIRNALKMSILVVILQ